MQNKTAGNDIYAGQGNATVQRTVIAGAVAACVVIASWLLFGDGLAFVSPWVGQRWSQGDEIRRLLLMAALSIYFLRLLCTQFLFLKRSVSWGEAGMVVPWILCIYLVLSIAGGTNTTRTDAVTLVGGILFIFGSWMNTWAEYERHVWKQRPENQGRLYTGGLFRYSRHPNYLGDLISFSGLCLLSGRWLTGVIPLIMFAGFVFSNIPMLDSHLRHHYGSAFDEYASQTRKLIPFVY